MSNKAVLLLVTFISMFAYSQLSISEDIYKYTDNEGKVHYTNDPTKVEDEKKEKVEGINNPKSNKPADLRVPYNSEPVFGDTNTLNTLDELNRKANQIRNEMEGCRAEIEKNKKLMDFYNVEECYRGTPPNTKWDFESWGYSTNWGGEK